jgi:peroxiredoxin
MELSTKYKQIEVLLKGMDLPFHRKKVINTDDIRWLFTHLKTKNSNHVNYEKVITLISECL